MIILCIFVIFLAIRLYIDHNWLKTTSYDVDSSKIPLSFDGYKIIQLSDLHNKEWKEKIITKIEGENPDIIVMTGDMVSANDIDFSSFFHLAKKLSEKYRVYYIKGNHEGRMKQTYYQKIESVLKAYGIIILDNEMIKLEKNNECINLYGMWANQRFYSRITNDKDNKITKKTIQKLLGKSDENMFNILLMHTPLYFDAYAQWGADLTLCGHIHGGMIRLPIVGGLVSPHLEILPHYCYGKYVLNQATMIISGGLSRGATGFRLFNRPEIVTVTLHSKK